jgi:hypothetical protein
MVCAIVNTSIWLSRYMDLDMEDNPHKQQRQQQSRQHSLLRNSNSNSSNDISS